MIDFQSSLSENRISHTVIFTFFDTNTPFCQNIFYTIHIICNTTFLNKVTIVLISIPRVYHKYTQNIKWNWSHISTVGKTLIQLFHSARILSLNGFLRQTSNGCITDINPSSITAVSVLMLDNIICDLNNQTIKQITVN